MEAISKLAQKRLGYFIWSQWNRYKERDGHGGFCSLSFKYTDFQMLRPLSKVVQIIPRQGGK